METIRSGGRMIPAEFGRAGNFEFPSEAATPSQLRTLDGLVTTFIRRDTIKRFQQLPAESLAKAVGLGPRQAANLLKEAKEARAEPVASLVIDVLHGMASGRIAGVLGHRKTEMTRWLFKLVNDYDLTETGIHVRLYLDDDGNDVGDSDYETSCDQFWQMHAAFRLDYMNWSRSK